jgi:hypothetical protein
MMSNQTPGDERSTTDQILDLLLDALAERQTARIGDSQDATSPPVPPPRPEPGPADQRVPAERVPSDKSGVSERRKAAEEELPRLHPAPAKTAQPPAKREPKPGEEGWEPPPPKPSIDMGKTLGRLTILVILLLVVVNVPVTRYGTSLARIMPDSASLIIRDGLVLKGSGPEIYILEDDRLRWISSLDAFEHMGLTWEDVRVVEDEFLNKFEKGAPIHVLLKCPSSPHIYRLENGQKRWIRDIDTFVAEGHVWDDVRIRGCGYLRDLPDGPTIPVGAGPPPQP